MIIDLVLALTVLLFTLAGRVLIDFWFLLRQRQRAQEEQWHLACYECAKRHADAIIAAGKGRGKGDE